MSTRPKQTGSQTAGPYLHIGMCPNAIGLTAFGGEDLGSGPIGPAEGRVTLEGTIYDGAGEPCRDALVEVYHAAGFARCPVDFESGRWSVRTAIPAGDEEHAFLNLWIVARGINRGLWTRVYFDAALVRQSSGLADLSVEQVQTVVARPVGSGHFAHDIYLQGPQETVFFELSNKEH